MTGRGPADYHAEFASIYDEMRSDVVSAATDVETFLRCVPLPRGSRVLDFGCGTGVHALDLASRGYRVTGIDVSREMIEQARARCEEENGVSLFCGDIAAYAATQAPSGFDGLYSFANVLNCLPDAQAMAGTLAGLARVMRSGARGLVDLWHVEPLLKDGARDTVRRVQTPQGEFVQAMHASFDAPQQRLEIEYRVFVSRDGGANWRQVQSTHRLRLLRQEQYRELFAGAGLRVLDVISQRPRGAALAGADERLACYLVERA